MNAFALIPFAVFAVFYVTLGVVARDFYRVPMTVAFLVAIASALFLGKGKDDRGGAGEDRSDKC